MSGPAWPAGPAYTLLPASHRWLRWRSATLPVSLSLSSVSRLHLALATCIHGPPAAGCSLFSCSLLLVRATSYSTQAAHAHADAVCKNIAVPATCTSATLHCCCVAHTKWTHTYHPCSVPTYLYGTIPGDASVDTCLHDPSLIPSQVAHTQEVQAAPALS